jgi:methyltransferase (TIGR00027 family)
VTPVSGRPSRTALLSAAARSLHLEELPPRVLDDDLALQLGGDEARALRTTLQGLPAEVVLAFSRWTCVRARVPEDLVQSLFHEGVRQYVILGAGLDSFAYRRRDLVDRLRVFEVDHPASQRWKRERLGTLGVDLPVNLVFAPVDFEREALRDGLEAAAFDFEAPAVFSWLGVTMYLTLDAIRATLTTLAACQPRTRVVLTYDLPRSELGELGRASATLLREIVAGMGEPMISFFTPARIEQLMRELGYGEIVHIGPDEARDTYFPGREDVRFGGQQRLVVATVSRSQDETR